MMKINLDWLWERLPRCPAWLDELFDKAHFAFIINSAVLVVSVILSLMTFDVFEPDHRPSFKTLVIVMIVVSLLVWGSIFGAWGWIALRGRYRRVAEDESGDLWDRWLDGPV